MARPLRLEFAGALYNVTSRGDRREDIFLSDEDRYDWLEVLSSTCMRFNWVVHAFCQMSNHYHLLLETVDGNLSRGMRQLNGHYTQLFNRRHALVGHLFQGRYKAILVQKEAYSGAWGRELGVTGAWGHYSALRRVSSNIPTFQFRLRRWPDLFAWSLRVRCIT